MIYPKLGKLRVRLDLFNTQDVVATQAAKRTLDCHIPKVKANQYNNILAIRTAQSAQGSSTFETDVKHVLLPISCNSEMDKRRTKTNNPGDFENCQKSKRTQLLD